CGHYAT
ncbi:hypothetical protein ACMD2_22349, partial [Ananas comosus]